MARSLRVDVVEDGAQQHLAADDGRRSGTGAQGDGGGEGSARAMPRDAEGIRVGYEPARPRGGERERAAEVVDGCREGMLGCEPVVHAQHLRACAGRERAAERVVGVEVARHPAATVREDEGPGHRRGERHVEPRPQGGARGIRRDLGVDRLDVLVIGQATPRRVRAQLLQARDNGECGVARGARRHGARLREQSLEVRSRLRIRHRGMHPVYHSRHPRSSALARRRVARRRIPRDTPRSRETPKACLGQTRRVSENAGCLGKTRGASAIRGMPRRNKGCLGENREHRHRTSRPLAPCNTAVVVEWDSRATVPTCVPRPPSEGRWAAKGSDA